MAKGYDQKFGVDYFKSFSPVARTVTVRMFFAIATAKQWDIHQIDVNNAYLHGILEEEIYLKPPLGYMKASQGQVCTEARGASHCLK